MKLLTVLKNSRGFFGTSMDNNPCVFICYTCSRKDVICMQTGTCGACCMQVVSRAVRVDSVRFLWKSPHARWLMYGDG